MSIPAGKLTHRVRFERRQAGEDEHGQVSETWTEIATRWAWPKFGTGQERREAAQISASLAGTFRVRACVLTRGLKPGDRMRADPVERVPADLAAAPVWDIKAVTMPETDAVDVAAVQAVT